jgi:hypothetical protein
MPVAAGGPYCVERRLSVAGGQHTVSGAYGGLAGGLWRTSGREELRAELRLRRAEACGAPPVAGWGARSSACGGPGRAELRLRRAGACGAPPAAGSVRMQSSACGGLGREELACGGLCWRAKLRLRRAGACGALCLRRAGATAVELRLRRAGSRGAPPAAGWGARSSACGGLKYAELCLCGRGAVSVFSFCILVLPLDSLLLSQKLRT